MNAFRSLSREQRQVGLAAAGLMLSMLLPWYSKDGFAVVAGRPQPVSDSLSAFGVFTFVEAAVLLVAGGVLYLLWARSQRRAFHLPGGDGLVVFGAGVWAGLLLVWRLFDKPDGEGFTFGIEWGMFFALAAAALLATAGARLKAAHVAEPPNPVAEEIPAPRRSRRPVDPSAVTEVLRDAPAWQGEPPPPPARAPRPGERPPDPPPPPPEPTVRRTKPRPEQPSLLDEDAPTDRLF